MCKKIIKFPGKNLAGTFLLFLCFFGLNPKGYGDIEIFNALDMDLENIFYYQTHNDENRLNPDNWLELENWQDTSVFSFSLLSDLNGWLSFHFKPEVSFFEINNLLEEEEREAVFQPLNAKEYYSLAIDRLSFSVLLLQGMFTLEVGKLLPNFGVGYGLRLTDFLADRTVYRGQNRSKYLFDLNFFSSLLNLELIYAPNRSWLPDDYAPAETVEANQDFWLARAGFSYLYNECSLLFFYGEGFSLGLNFSSQIGDELIPYCELVVSDDNRIGRMVKEAPFTYDFKFNDSLFFQSLLGLCYSPSFMDFSFYLECLFNQDGYSRSEWEDYRSNLEDIRDFPPQMSGLSMQYLGAANSNFSLSGMSKLYCLLHLAGNDYIGDIVKITNTVMMTYPFGCLDNLNLSFKIWEDIHLDLEFFGLLYADEDSEYAYFPYNTKTTLNLNYRMSF